MTQKPNMLINEKSPYLLQHAYNPVQWFPWCDAAFEVAKKTDKPIMLSIGYSTCHWCHVMERESFEDNEVAAVLNEYFVCIKVDREERPDIDAVYMEASQLLTGGGGWPLTVFMDAKQKPFYIATYLPKQSVFGRIGLIELSERIHALWTEDRSKLTEAAKNVMGILNRAETKTGINVFPKELCEEAFQTFESDFDRKNGGFGGAPKFPSPHNLLFIMKYSKYDQGVKSEMAQKTLTQLYRGGIFDHIGGGFSRYSTDEKYLVPHFEKMLYDNALLIYAYAFFLQTDENVLFRHVLEKTADYVLRKMRDESGGFYCAQDADSGGKEGDYYLFSPGDIRNILGAKSADKFCAEYDITQSGHVEGLSVPNLLKNKNYESAMEFMDSVRDKLDSFRKTKTLFRDDKILTSWNGLMIAALAKAGLVTNRKEYIAAAAAAADFIQKNRMSKDNRLLRWTGGKNYFGQLDDYAFYAWGLLELYAATLKIEYLESAAEISETMYRLFHDEGGGLFMNDFADANLIKRPKEFYDGATPSGNSAALFVFNRLARLTAESKWILRSMELTNTISAEAKRYPSAYCFALFAMLDSVYPSCELMITTPENEISKNLESLQKIADMKNAVIVVKNDGNRKRLSDLAPFTNDYPIANKTLFYLCRGDSCKAPVESAEEAMKLLLNE